MTTEETHQPHKRRVRYRGKNPRRFEDKYKKLNPELYADTVAHVLASGKTPAGQHVPIMVTEIIQALSVQPGDRVIDCTLGYGGAPRCRTAESRAARRLRTLGVDQDPLELPKTEKRLRSAGYPEESLLCKHTNFVALPTVLGKIGWHNGAAAILADLGVSSMQIDNPARVLGAMLGVSSIR